MDSLGYRKAHMRQEDSMKRDERKARFYGTYTLLAKMAREAYGERRERLERARDRMFNRAVEATLD